MYEISRDMQCISYMRYDCRLRAEASDPEPSREEWREARDKQLYGVPSLLKKLNEYLQNEMQQLKDAGRTKSLQYYECKEMIEECKGWFEEDYEFLEN